MDDVFLLPELHVPYATAYWKLSPQVGIDVSDDLLLGGKTFSVSVCFYLFRSSGSSDLLHKTDN